MTQNEHHLDFERVASDVEAWGESILFGERADEDGWKEVKGWSMFNRGNHTRCYLKWFKDSREEYAEPDDEQVYPCMKLYSTIDAPMSDVCSYLSNEEHYREYNALVVKHKVLEEISPNSKICWGQSPQILFITPRDFVSFVSHRWRADGTQVLISQACEHPDAPASKTEGKDQTLRAISLRNAHFVSPDPEEPATKTKFCFVCHCYPGKEVPHWLSEQGVNILAPIEAFKLMHNIIRSVPKHAPYPTVNDKEEEASEERSKKPGGMSMMGFGAFWPEGGGLKET